MSARILSIPDKLLNIHGYHPEIRLLEEILNKAKLGSLGKTEGVKGKLISKQKGFCNLCGKALFTFSDYTTIDSGNLDVDHITQISEGGSKTNLDNLSLTHR